MIAPIALRTQYVLAAISSGSIDDAIAHRPVPHVWNMPLFRNYERDGVRHCPSVAARPSKVVAFGKRMPGAFGEVAIADAWSSVQRHDISQRTCVTVERCLHGAAASLTEPIWRSCAASPGEEAWACASR